MKPYSIDIFGYTVTNNSPYGYLVEDSQGHVMSIQPEAKHGQIFANLKSVYYKKSNRVYTARTILNKYQGLAWLIAEELAKIEPIYDYTEKAFYNPLYPNDYWKRNGVVYNE